MLGGCGCRLPCPRLTLSLSIQLFHNKVAEVASPLHPLWVLLSTDVIWKHTMHNMRIIATNHLSMLTVYVRHRDPNCPASSPRLLCCHISRGRNGDTSSQYFHYFPTICKSITGTPHTLSSHIQTSAIVVRSPLPKMQTLFNQCQCGHVFRWKLAFHAQFWKLWQNVHFAFSFWIYFSL